jgi:signal transduction histidine kinase
MNIKSFFVRRQIGPEDKGLEKKSSNNALNKGDTTDSWSFITLGIFVLYAVAILFVVLASVLSKDQDEHQQSTNDKHQFKSSLSFNLIISFVIFSDVVTEYSFQRQIDDLIRPFLLLFIMFPNILIYFEVIPLRSVPLVQYFQYISLLELLSYQIQSLSTLQNVKLSNNNIMKICALTIVSFTFAFLYQISLLNVLSTPLVYHILFTVSLFALHYQVYYQTFYLIKETLSMILFQQQNIIYCHQTKKKVFFSYLFLEYSTCVWIVLFLIFSFVYYENSTVNERNHNNVIFFPSQPSYFIILEWYFTILLIALFLLYNTSLRNKSSVSSKELSDNKMLTRSISHEIRTPLNTAFMGLELLQDSMKYPNFKESEVDRLNNWLESVDNVREACDIALGILNQLLTFDKLQSGMLSLERKLIPILSLIDMNTKLFRMQVNQFLSSFVSSSLFKFFFFFR